MLPALAGFAGNLSVTLSNSPFIVDSVYVLDTLIVEPGSSVFFKGGSGLLIRSYLYSVGTASARITFASAESGPTAFDWNGVAVDTHATAFVAHSQFSNCIECIKSFSPDIALDSVQFSEVGEERFLLNDSTVALGPEPFFSYHLSLWADFRKAKSGRSNRHLYWIVGGVAGAAAAAAWYFLPGEESRGKEEAPQGHTIKYPNLPY
jgi:hypothetical protein